jgi:hypothetical protein
MPRMPHEQAHLRNECNNRLLAQAAQLALPQRALQKVDHDSCCSACAVSTRALCATSALVARTLTNDRTTRTTHCIWLEAAQDGTQSARVLGVQAPCDVACCGGQILQAAVLARRLHLPCAHTCMAGRAGWWRWLR